MRCTETPENRLIHSRKKKNFERPPRELQCLDRAHTSTRGSGRPSCVDVVLGFWLKVLVRRDTFENRRKFHKCTYTLCKKIVLSWTTSSYALLSHKTLRRTTERGRPFGHSSRRNLGTIRAECRTWRALKVFFPAGSGQDDCPGSFSLRRYFVPCILHFSKCWCFSLIRLSL